jgi:hypothetical protein
LTQSTDMLGPQTLIYSAAGVIQYLHWYSYLPAALVDCYISYSLSSR